MPGQEIFLPFLSMLALTMLVWIYMYYHRLTYIARNKVDPETLKSGIANTAELPSNLVDPSNNLKNLFEIPVLFYALCLYLFVTGSVDTVYVTCAWLFFIFRALHSAVHCTVNIVRLRFGVYAVSTIVLLFMIVRALLAL